uniref:Uncharacterized protein n=1 Tax=Lepeophtheirus salmonis TaxID=72036 RepID=A0A0K2U416_LEPSM
MKYKTKYSLTLFYNTFNVSRNLSLKTTTEKSPKMNCK